jgi:hypothetical protein
MQNGSDSLPVFPQGSRLARTALQQLVVGCVHGAKLPVVFWTQHYLFQKTFFAFFQLVFFCGGLGF